VTPGERITLIRESARLLATRDWSDIDLVLQQFGLPIDNSSHGGEYQYVLDMIAKAPDADLRQLHSFLVGESGTPFVAQPWAEGQLKLFMSHLAIHQEFVGQVGSALGWEGVSAFVAHTSIEPSREWQAVIEACLRSCDAMVVFLHKGFHESMWCDQEVGFGLARQIPILPIVIDIMPYGFMSKFQIMGGKDKTPWLLALEITDWLVGTPSVQTAITEGIVTAFERCPSYGMTRQLTALLQRLPRFTPDQLERLLRAAESNEEILNAGVDWRPAPEVIRELVAQHGGRAPEPVDDEVPF
jgi:hypothetical protein